MVYFVTTRRPHEHSNKEQKYLFQFHTGKYSDFDSSINDY